MSKISAPKSSRRPRRPEPFFRTQTRSWYVQIGSRQIALGRDRQVAWAKYDELMASGNRVGLQVTAAQILDEFLEHALKNRSKATFLWYRNYLRSFVASVGKKLLVADLKPLHVTQWLDKSFADLSPSSRNCGVRAIKSAFNWAVDEGYLDRSPIRGVKRPPAGRREMVLTAEEFRKLILDRCSDQLEKDLLVFLWETGARVQEVRRITVKHFDEANKRIILPPSEDKVGHYRVIHLTETACEIIERLCGVHREGILFRNRLGRPWTSNAIRCRFRKFGVRGLCGTVLRHSFCQRLLTSGVDSLSISVLMGHHDLTMVARTYSHLAQNADFLRQQLRHAATSAEALTPGPAAASSPGSGPSTPAIGSR
jgi:integrase